MCLRKNEDFLLIQNNTCVNWNGVNSGARVAKSLTIITAISVRSPKFRVDLVRCGCSLVRQRTPKYLFRPAENEVNQLSSPENAVNCGSVKKLGNCLPNPSSLRAMQEKSRILSEILVRGYNSMRVSNSASVPQIKKGKKLAKHLWFQNTSKMVRDLKKQLIKKRGEYPQTSRTTRNAKEKEIYFTFIIVQSVVPMQFLAHRETQFPKFKRSLKWKI